MKQPNFAACRTKFGEKAWHLFLLLFLVTFLQAAVQAAPRRSLIAEIKGKVTNLKNGEALPGVSILEKGTTNGTISDVDGTYNIRVQEGAKLVFSYIGYVTKEIVVENSNVINVGLEESNQNLEQVVVIGYGTLKSTQVSSAISKISSKDIDERPISRVDHALVGKLAGVQVQQVSGSPGQPYKIKVRGVNSINNSSSPLYVVDGFPISGDLNSINSNDIESIEVLKDAASAAIYGSRGSSGVVLITTKSGSDKPTLQLNSYYGIQKRFSKIDVLNRDEFIEFAIEERNNSWVLNGGNASDSNSARSASRFWIDPLWLTDPKSLPDNDWQKLSEQYAPVNDIQLSASGSSGNSKYYISGNYFKQKGIIIGSDFSRLSFRSNVESKISKRISLGLNLAASSTNQNGSSEDIAAGGMNLEQLISQRAMAPTLELNQQSENGGYSPYYATFIINPLAIAREYKNNLKRKELLTNIYTNIELIKDLKLRSSLGYNYMNGANQVYFPTNIRRANPSTASASVPNRENYLTEHLLSYKLAKQDWNLDVLGGFTYQKETALSYSLANTGYPDDVIQTMNAGTTPTAASSNISEWTLMSFLSRVNFSLLEKYVLTASMRRDGSSRFGSDNRWGWFPSVSVGWLINEEKMMKDVDFISQLKLRASLGQAGNNNISNYASRGTLSQDNYTFGNTQTVAAGFVPGSFSNSNLGWERTTTLDIGVDLGVFNNRVVLGLDYYRADTRDLLLNVQIPAITGFSNSTQNIGKVRNSGVELELASRNTTGALKWTTNFNIAFNKNKVLQLGKNGDPIFGNVWGSDVTITRIGDPIGSYYMLIQEGVFMNQQDFDSNPHYKNQNVGDLKFKDINQDGVIDEKDKMIAGNNNPKYFWGMTNTFSYKNLDLSISADGQGGNKMLNLGRVEGGQSRGNVDGYWRDRWRSEQNPGNGMVPRAAVTDNLSTISTYLLNNAAFWRIRTISLGYKLPDSVTKEWKAFNSLRIYASVDNVYMHDEYNHNVQQGSLANSNLAPGVEYIGTYPLATTYTLGVNLKF